MNADYIVLFESIVSEPVLECEVMLGSRTNVNVHVKTTKGEYAMRVPGKGTNGYIDRAAEAANVQKLSYLSFTPEVIYANAETGVLITRFLEGARSLTLNAYKHDVDIQDMCSILAELHRSDVTLSNEIDLVVGVREYHDVLKREGCALPSEVTAAQARLDLALDALLSEYALTPVPSHGDPNAANFVRDSKHLWLIDWEYSGMADPYFDLADVVLTDCLDENAEARMITAYEGASGVHINPTRWSLFKASIDYMWLFWHLIKLSQGQMIEYNEAAWHRRLSRALSNLNKIGL